MLGHDFNLTRGISYRISNVGTTEIIGRVGLEAEGGNGGDGLQSILNLLL